MAEFAYSLDGGIGITKDYAASAAYSAAIAKKGELVEISATTGNPVKLTGTSTVCAGIVEGAEFVGLVGQGQPYAATNASNIASNTANANGTLKVRIGKEAVYRIAKGNVTAANIGAAVGVDANQAGATAATGKPLRVIDVQGDYAFVSLI